jgi:hypothetical protein
MTPAQKSVIKKLLIGYSLVKHYTFNRKWCYRLIDTKGTTTEYVQCRTVDKLKRYGGYKKKLFKKDSIGRLTLNLTTVRQLHGRCTIKQLYKNRQGLKDETNNKKQRAGKKAAAVNNDAALYLF